MSPREQDLVSTVPYTGPAVYTKPVLRSSGSVDEFDDESNDSSDEESVGPAEEAFGHTKEAASSYICLATDYLASFKAAQLGLKAADGVLDTLDRATRCEDDCKEVDCVESLPVQKFCHMNFDAEVYNSEGDSDYCPSEDCEEDDLEYDSEAEVSDAEAEVVCEKAKANTYVGSLQRQCRAVRRAGTKRAGTDRPVHTIGEASLVGAICETFHLNFFLSVVGLKLEPVNKIIFKQVTATSEEEDHTEVAFSQLNLKGYDSAEDADYWPGESGEDSDLEYDSDAEISEESDEDCDSDDEDHTKPVLRSSGAKLNNGLNMKDYEEDDSDYSDESDSSEVSDEEVTEEVPTQMFGKVDFNDYDSADDSDYCPGESEEDSDLEYDSEAEISEESDEELHTEVEMPFQELNFKDYVSEDDEDYCPSESDDEELETYTKPVLRSSASKLNDGLDMKDYEEDAAHKYDSDESDSSEESDEEVTEEEEPTQKFGEIIFDDYEDAAYCPSESEDYHEAETFTKPVLRNSASAAHINNGLIFKDYVEDVDYSSESEEDSDSDTEISEESDEEEHIEEVAVPFSELDFKGYVSGDDEDYCPGEDDDDELETFVKPVSRSSAAELNDGLVFEDYEEDVNYSSSESEEDSDSDAEISEETDED